MNILESSIKLYEWFAEHDSFCIEEDFIRVILVTTEPERDKASFLSALKTLEKYEVIQCEEVSFKKEKRKVWTLERPLDSMSQKIDIDFAMAATMADIINRCATQFNIKDAICDPHNITSDNLKDLILLAGAGIPSEENLDKGL